MKKLKEFKIREDERIKIFNNILKAIEKNEEYYMDKLEKIEDDISLSNSYIKILNLLRRQKKEASSIIYKDSKFTKNTNIIKSKLLNILNVVAEVMNVSIEDIKEESRDQKIVFIRQLFFYIARKNTNFSALNIAATANKKTHSIVLHSVKTIENLIDIKDKEYGDITELIKLIENNI